MFSVCFILCCFHSGTGTTLASDNHFNANYFSYLLIGRMHEPRMWCWQREVQKMLNSSGNVSVCLTLFCFHFDIKFF